MKLPIKVLDIFFRRIDAETVLRTVLDGFSAQGRERYKELFLSMAETTLGGYSHNEQENIYQYAHQQYEKYTAEEYLPPFYLLVDFAANVLEMGNAEPVCRYEEVLSWRDAYLLLGQDIFTTAWLAWWQRKRQQPLHFSWPAVIPCNDAILNQTLQGLSENHLHLYAGASTFSLTWSCLMNDPRCILDHPEVERLLQPRFARETAATDWSMTRRMLYAAKLRMLLFKRLRDSDCKMFDKMQEFDHGYLAEDYNVDALANEADSLRFLFGVKFDQPDQTEPVCLDYAFSRELSGERESHSRLLAGERYLLYGCFTRCFSEGADAFSFREQWLFYTYLLLKAQFRSELIQVNRQTGFHNFSSYDHRKYKLWENKPAYWNEDYRQVLNAAFEEQYLGSLEGRLSPKKTGSDDLALIHGIDRAKRFFDAKTTGERNRERQWQSGWTMKNRAAAEKYCFVMHFTKKPDATLSQKGVTLPRRHDVLRESVRQQAIALASALSNSDYFCHRIRGIDACSNEIGCRPEVFSVAFRFLQGFSTAAYRCLPFVTEEPRIATTYHVGEDFLDIADGLRAMDEAICFLDLRRGSRFGHALALGVDPALHYETKHRQIILPAQELLDNLAWLCFRSTELNVTIPEKLKNELLLRAGSLFDEIYGSVCPSFTSGGCNALEYYYQAMLLRGDAPECYKFDGKTASFCDISPYDQFYSFYANDTPEIALLIEKYRSDPKLCQLYYCYHYSYDVRKNGAKIVSMDISPSYISLIRQMQIAMRREINERGISIECNPSSNVLIGTFSDYHNHPILNFNNEGLNLPKLDVQMHVSINSDDPGVFDTTLSFEYALLAKTLAEKTDANGNRIHSGREIEGYIRNLLRMGKEQSFLLR